MKPKHNHAEAFAVMKYASKDGGVVELIWNSRDGVTPFIVMSKDGQVEMQHVEWRSDLYAPDRPNAGLKVGDCIFVNMTEERARDFATRRVDQVTESMPEFAPKNEDERKALIEDLVESNMEHPDIVVVDEKLLAELQAKAPKILSWTERTGHSGRYG